MAVINKKNYMAFIVYLFCFTVSIEKALSSNSIIGDEFLVFKLKKWSLKLLSGIYNGKITIHGYAKRKVIFNLTNIVWLKVPRIKVTPYTQNDSTSPQKPFSVTILPNFMLPYQQHCIKSILLNLEYQNEQSDVSSPALNLLPMQQADELINELFSSVPHKKRANYIKLRTEHYLRVFFENYYPHYLYAHDEKNYTITRNCLDCIRHFNNKELKMYHVYNTKSPYRRASDFEVYAQQPVQMKNKIKLLLAPTNKLNKHLKISWLDPPGDYMPFLERLKASG